MIALADIEAARLRIGERVRRTPIVMAEGAAFGTSVPVALKLELLQHTGSFKPRGVFNRILFAMESDELPKEGVIGASGGNAGMAIAYAARAVGVSAEIFVPEATSKVKVDRIRKLGANVTISGAFYADAYEACLERSAETGALFVHAYDQPEVVAGQGTIGLELLEQIVNLDTVLVAVGGGGLVAGIAAALIGKVNVVAVEPERIPTLHRALDAGQPVDVEVSGVAADSLGAKRLGEVAWEVARETGVQSVLVEETSIIKARQRLWEEFRVVAEFGGATALAAIVDGAYVPNPAERIAVVVCGGNTDPSDLANPR